MRRIIPTAFQIEFIRHVDGRPEPDVLHVVDGVFPRLDDAVMKGNLLFWAIDETRGAEGFRVVQNGQGIVAHRFQDSGV